MKKGLSILGVLLIGISLVGCGNSKQAKENSSLKAENSSLKEKKQKQENSSLKAGNASLKSSSDQNNTTSNSSSHEDPASLSNEEVAQRVKAYKGDTAPGYNTLVTNNGDGTYDVELRKDSPDREVANMIGTYTYNAKNNTITTKFETGLD